MGMVTGVGQVLVPVQDVERAIGFYRDVLGLELVLVPPGQPMAFLMAGDVRLYLDAHPSEDERRSPLIYYRVDSPHEATEAARAAGAEIVAEPHVVHRTATSELTIAFLRDTEGNLLALMAEGDPG
jgi:catechol 2,3-dioxygenase-like lactoylglutathione lyase family enzyme